MPLLVICKNGMLSSPIDMDIVEQNNFISGYFISENIRD